MESQIKHWQDYNNNLAMLTERSGDFEGLADMVNTFADGSTQSIAMVAGITRALEEENYDAVSEMIKTWQSLQVAQRKRKRCG
ncbi:MAG: hypothetical protein LBE35_07535 [Clostridiales bacterium]|jgi:hypothetical protein|nr:hypothetical protein [Clostridiales bacterium]